jgi:nickel transport protein
VLSTRPFSAPAGAVVAVSYDNGFWIKLPGDKLETNASKIMAPKGTAAHMTVKYGKLLLGAGGYRTVVGSRLELVALKDPFALAAGQTLPVRLQLNGKPVPGAEIAYTDGLQPIPDAKQPTVKTDADGVAQVPAPRKGASLLTTDIETAPAHPALAEQDHIYASLAFDTSH